jgi:transcriptional regulator with GAF, ATPase, and Fis domain
MEISDQDFFHQATLRICGSLHIEKVINDCYEYLKDFIPINGIFLNTYDSKSGLIRNITKVSTADIVRAVIPIDISVKIRNMILKNIDVVYIENEAEKHPIGRFFKPYMGCDVYSALVLRLTVEGEILGVFVLFADGHDRFTQEHAHLLSLLHDPLSLAMSNTLKHQEVLKLKELLADDNRYLKQEIHQLTGDEIIGANFGLKDIMEMVRQVAPLSSQVLILGETGAGKEVIANAIHYSSPRCDEAFIKVNCGAIPENLIDSELFGHEKGAFTGAISQKRGRFERAHKGTIFLDEIGELPPPAQVRLLRVIQNREIERVGGDKPIPIDIRIIVATHRNLEEMVRDGKFREDLWFRLNVFPIVVPPLRMRKSDIPALVNYFIGKKSKELNLGHHPIKAANSYKILQNYHWPGNVRELENLVERVLIKNRTAPTEIPLSFDGLLLNKDGNQIDTEDTTPNIENIDSLPLNLDEANRLLIERALKSAKGRVQGEKGAAKFLGINPNTLRNRMKKLEIAYGRNPK